MCPRKVDRIFTSQSGVSICENSIAKDVIKAATAEMIIGFLISTIRKQQYTIIAHNASPQAAGTNFTLRDKSPRAISNAIPDK
jgi:hypothetical protein